jgi:spore coat polysaccharide biosynthesis protein SpsF
MSTAIIVQARMTSERLPGKVLVEVAGKPLLEHQLDRLRRVTRADRVIVATTTSAADEPIARLCAGLDVDCFQGSELDVLGRYGRAAKEFGVETVVRATADCPLIDPAVMDEVIALFANPPRAYDYVSNTLTRSYPRGMDCEVFSARVLREIDAEALQPYEREHVTPRIYQNPDRYRLGSVVNPRDESHHRWTVDTREDLELIDRMLNALLPAKPHFTMQDCLTLLDSHPDWLALNATVEQKSLQQ